MIVLGSTIGSYLVREKIGEGGMGTVYVADHTVLGRRAAIKVLLPEMSNDHSVVTRFFNEARAASSIRHPSIVEIYDFGYTPAPESQAFIVMEFLEGESLATRKRRLGRVDPRRAMLFARQIAGGLAAAHDLGIVHRDLKPDNIYLVPDPEVQGGERIKLLDFGIAKLQKAIDDTSRTQTGSVLGTPTYMAPEQCRGSGSVDARADLYALGCVLYELLAGRPPFVVDGAGDLIAHHLYFEPAPLRQLDPALPEAVERIVMWLLRKDPNQRPPNARELVLAIDRAGLGTGVGDLPPTVHGTGPVVVKPVPTTLSAASGIQAPTRPNAPRRRWVAPAVAVTVVAAGIAIYVAVANKSESSPVAPPEPVAARPSVPVEPAKPVPVPVQPVQPVQPAQPALPPKPAPVKLTIDTDPEGASVVFAGKPVGITPYVDSVESGGPERVYTLAKDGFDKAVAAFTTDRDHAAKVVLRKKKAGKPPTTPGLGDQGVNPFD